MPQPKGYGSAQAPDAAPDELDSLRDELERQRAKLEQAERDRALLTDEMQLEHALLDAVVRQMPAGLAVADALTGLFVLRNEQASLIWGRDPSGPLLERFEELRGRRADGTPLASDEWPLARSIHEGETVAGEEIWFTRLDGSEGVMEVSATPVRDATGRVTAGVALLLDVTDRKRTEERLQSARAEREVLLREARHQVGNNLQVVTSLLGLQARATRDDESRKLVLESLSRIQAMAQAHEQISQAPDLAHIDLNLYIGQIVEGLRELYVRQENPPVIAVDVEPLSLGLNTVINCGLVVNELVSNALKYAFVDGRAGRVTIEMREAVPGEVELVVGDDGVGLPEAISPPTASTLGLPLANHLARQLGGSLRVDRSPGGGSTFRVRFPIQAASGASTTNR